MAGKVTKVEMLKNETPKCDRIFWHSRQFLVMELNFLGLETRKYMFYHQINGTTFFLAYFLTLEYILEIFRAQLTNIFRKNARGGKCMVFPLVSNIVRFTHDVHCLKIWTNKTWFLGKNFYISTCRIYWWSIFWFHTS